MALRLDRPTRLRLGFEPRVCRNFGPICKRWVFDVERMQRLPRVILIVLGLLVAYAAWPLHAAVQIRHALIEGDAETLKQRIDWEAVRASLKRSVNPDALASLEADPQAPPPTMWQRVKAVVTPAVSTRAIDRFVTPEYLPVLLGFRRFWRGTVQPAIGPEEQPTVFAGTLFAGSALDKAASFWRRLKRAVFHSPIHLEVEIEDKYRPGRSYTALLELQGWQWKLTHLAVNEAKR